MTIKPKTYAQLVTEIGETFRKWNRIAHVITEEGIEIRNDLAPRSRTKRWQTAQEREIRFSFFAFVRNRGTQIRVAVRREDTATENLRLIAVAVEMMRLADVRGVAEILAIVYRQMYPVPEPIPAPRQEPPRIPPHYATLHLAADAPLEVAEAAYRSLVKLHHPDVGGDVVRMQQINAAMDLIRKEKA